MSDDGRPALSSMYLFNEETKVTQTSTCQFPLCLKNLHFNEAGVTCEVDTGVKIYCRDYVKELSLQMAGQRLERIELEQVISLNDVLEDSLK